MHATWLKDLGCDFNDLTAQSLEVGELQVVWGCGPRCPTSNSYDGEPFSLLVGYVVDT